MDYDALAGSFMRCMHRMRRSHPQRAISRAVQGEKQVLHCIAEEGSSLRPSDISEKMGISTARIAATLNALEGKGQVTRRIDESDRRRILVELTAEGSARATLDGGARGIVVGDGTRIAAGAAIFLDAESIIIEPARAAAQSLVISAVSVFRMASSEIASLTDLSTLGTSARFKPANAAINTFELVVFGLIVPLV